MGVLSVLHVEHLLAGDERCFTWNKNDPQKIRRDASVSRETSCFYCKGFGTFVLLRRVSWPG